MYIFDRFLYVFFLINCYKFKYDRPEALLMLLRLPRRFGRLATTLEMITNRYTRVVGHLSGPWWLRREFVVDQQPADSPDGSSPSRRSREMIFALPISPPSPQRQVRQVKGRSGQQNDPRCSPAINPLRSHQVAWMTPHTLWYRLTNVPNARTNLLKYLGGYRSAQSDPKVPNRVIWNYGNL